MTELLEYASSIERRFKPAMVGDHRIDPRRRTCRRAKMTGPLGSELAERILASVPSFLDALRVTSFSIGEVELEVVAYEDGAHHGTHLDTAYGNGNSREGDRRLTAVYYFFRQPKKFDGGNLRLHAFGRGAGPRASADIEPICNQLVVFPSWAPHEVLPVSVASGQFEDSRFAINCWVSERTVSARTDEARAAPTQSGR
ncbi:MAG: 2OG-Fe(II) oxygenase [Rhizomicrobium sp.]